MGINRIRKENETFEEKQQSQRDWAKENGLFNEKWVHPSYDDTQVGIMQLGMTELVRGVDRGTNFTTSQRLQETLRREWRGAGQGRNNYIGASIRLYLTLVDEVSKDLTLTEGFSSVRKGADTSTGRTALGTELNGKFYVPGLGYVDYGKFFIAEKVYRFKKAWTDETTMTAQFIVGDRFIRDLSDEEIAQRNLIVATTRRAWITDGTAIKLAEKFGLTASVVDKLPISFKGVEVNDEVVTELDKEVTKKGFIAKIKELLGL